MDADATLLEGLTAAQRAAVTTTAAPLCIQAAAGAGKTSVLARRIAYRVSTGSADAAHVLALTFTRKAAEELTARLRAFGVRDAVTAGTFHGVAYAQLRQYWRDRRQRVPGLLPRKSRLLAHLVPGRPHLADAPLALLAAEIEWAQARGLSPADYEQAAAAGGRRPPAPLSAVARLFDRYEAEKRRRQLVDFDDLLSLCSTALRCEPPFAAAQRWRWQHVFVDEFQDVNPLQDRLLCGWLGDNLDLCVVGDPNQAVYAWNGADPDLLAGLPQRWPGAEVVHLDANHRCSPQVVAVAAAVLGPPGSALCSSRPDGPPPAVRAYATDQEEANGVAREVRRAHAAGLPWSQLAVLMRTNAQAALFRQALTAAMIPVRVSAGDGLLDDPAVVRVLTDLRRRCPVPLAMVVADLAELADEARRRDSTTGDVETDRDAADAPVLAGGWAGRAVASPAGAGLPDPDAAGSLYELARSYQHLDPGATTEGFLSWLPTAAARGDRPDSSTDAVAVCTFHRAKGLGWSAVWVTGLERGLVPIGHAVTDDAEAEERRLLYVALTRAERELNCSWARARRFGGALVPREASPWLGAVSQASSRATGAAVDPEVCRRGLAAARGRLGVRGSPSGPPGITGPRRPEPDPMVLGALVDWRARAARAASVPPSVLLHDATLAALACARPMTTDELLAVPGIGGVKAARYGEALLAAIATCGVPA